MKTDRTVPQQQVRRDGVLTTVHVLPPGVSDHHSARVAAAPLPPASSSFFSDDDGYLASQIDSTVPATEAAARGAEFFGGDIVTSGNNSWRIEDTHGFDAAGAYCKFCGEFFDTEVADDLTTEGWVDCSECGQTCTKLDKTIGFGVRGYDVALMRDPNEVYERVWYHTSKYKNWLSKVQEPDEKGHIPLVHVGTEDASMYRAKHVSDKSWWRDDEDEDGVAERGYIYEIRVKRGAPVAPEVMGDIDGRAPASTRDTQEGFDTSGVTRYVNEFEHIGSVSLLANPEMLEVVSMKRVRYDASFDEWFTE